MEIRIIIVVSAGGVECRNAKRQTAGDNLDWLTYKAISPDTKNQRHLKALLENPSIKQNLVSQLGRL